MRCLEYDLKPCPFCGGVAEAKSYHANYDDKISKIVCTECGVETALYEFLSRAIEAWNRRAGDEGL